MTEALSLSQLVDLALGTPEVGSVNFNVLHTLLHAVLSKLDIAAVKAEISEADKNHLTLIRERSSLLSSRASTTGKDSGLETDGESGKEDVIPRRRSHHHALEAKLADLEDKLQALDKLPSNEDLFSRTRESAASRQPRPVSDMWQTMQLAKRVDANETGVGKVGTKYYSFNSSYKFAIMIFVAVKDNYAKNRLVGLGFPTNNLYK